MKCTPKQIKKSPTWASSTSCMVPGEKHAPHWNRKRERSRTRRGKTWEKGFLSTHLCVQHVVHGHHVLLVAQDARPHAAQLLQGAGGRAGRWAGGRAKRTLLLHRQESSCFLFCSPYSALQKRARRMVRRGEASVGRGGHANGWCGEQPASACVRSHRCTDSGD